MSTEDLIENEQRFRWWCFIVSFDVTIVEISVGFSRAPDPWHLKINLSDCYNFVLKIQLLRWNYWVSWGSVGCLQLSETKTVMALFHCMTRFRSLLEGIPLGTVPGTFLVPPQPRFQAYRYQNFFINHKLSVSLSVQVQTLLSLIVRSRSSESLMARRRRKKTYVYIHLNLLYFQSMSSVYIFTLVSVLLQLKTIWSNKCTSRLY